MDITKLMQEQADDAAALAEREKRQPDQASLTAQISDYLSDKLSAAAMKALSDTHGPQIDAEIQSREQAARQACFEFGQKHYVIRSNVENQLMLLAEVQNRKQFVTVPNLESAFRDLLARKAFIEVVEPVQSAADFKAAHIEDWPAPSIPPLVLEGIARALDSFVAGHPEYIRSEANKNKIMAALTKSGLQIITVQAIEEVYQDLVARGELELNSAVQRGEVLRYVDMGGHAPGYPAQPRRYSLKAKLKSMTADEVKERILDDPNFESALDSLK